MKKKNTKGNQKKYIILCVISLILAIITEYILVSSETFSQFSIGNILAIFGIVAFLGLHFIVDKKKMYNFIIDNRYIISIVLIIVSTIIGFLQNTISIKEWLLTTNMPLCLWWNIKFCAIILASFEFWMIITENRKTSAVGSVLVAFSGTVQWNFEYINSIIFGEIIIVLLNKILTEDKNKILYFIINIILSFLYMQTTSSFAIAFGYIWLALAIWLLIKNKESKNFTLGVASVILDIVIMIISLKFINFGFKSDPIIESRSIFYLLAYPYNVILPFVNMNLKYIFGSFISLFPIPMIIALYYLYKYDDHTAFLLPLVVVTVLETIFCISGFPEIVNNILGFEGISAVRVSATVNFANLLLLLYIISNVKLEMSLKTAVRLTILSVAIVGIVVVFINNAAGIFFKNSVYIVSAELGALYILFYNYENRKYKKVLLFILVTLTLISGVFVNPIVKDKNEVVTAAKVETIEK